MRKFLILASTVLAVAGGGAAQASSVIDAAGDLGTAVRSGGGPTAAADAILRDDLDLTRFSATFDGTNFLLSAAVADTIDLHNDSRFVIGIDTGVRTQSAAFPTNFFFGHRRSAAPPAPTVPSSARTSTSRLSTAPFQPRPNRRAGR